MRLQMAINVGCLPNDQNVGENQGKNYELILGRLVVFFCIFRIFLKHQEHLPSLWHYRENWDKGGLIRKNSARALRNSRLEDFAWLSTKGSQKDIACNRLLLTGEALFGGFIIFTHQIWGYPSQTVLEIFKCLDEKRQSWLSFSGCSVKNSWGGVFFPPAFSPHGSGATTKRDPRPERDLWDPQKGGEAAEGQKRPGSHFEGRSLLHHHFWEAGLELQEWQAPCSIRGSRVVRPVLASQ